jgi:hypothetical protein
VIQNSGRIGAIPGIVPQIAIIAEREAVDLKVDGYSRRWSRRSIATVAIAGWS